MVFVGGLQTPPSATGQKGNTQIASVILVSFIRFPYISKGKAMIRPYFTENF